MITSFSPNILMKHIVQEIFKLRYLFNVKLDVDVLFLSFLIFSFFEDFHACFTTCVVVMV